MIFWQNQAKAEQRKAEGLFQSELELTSRVRGSRYSSCWGQQASSCSQMLLYLLEVLGLSSGSLDTVRYGCPSTVAGTEAYSPRPYWSTGSLRALFRLGRT